MSKGREDFEPIDFPVVDGRLPVTDIPVVDAGGHTLLQIRVTADTRPTHRALMVGVVSPEGFAYHLDAMRGQGHNRPMLTYLDQVATHLLQPRWMDGVNVNPQLATRAPMDALSSNLVLIDCHGRDEAAMWALKTDVVKAIRADVPQLCATYEALYGKRERPEQRARQKAEVIMGLPPVSEMKHLTVEALAAHFMTTRHLGVQDRDKPKHATAAQNFILEGGRYVEGEPEISKPQFVGDTEIKYPKTMQAREIIADASFDFARAEAAQSHGRGGRA